MKKHPCVTVLVVVGFLAGIVAGCSPAQKTEKKNAGDTTVVIDTVTAAAVDTTAKPEAKK